MKDRIAVVVIDMNTVSHQWDDYANLSATQKINLLIQHVDLICKELKTQEPNAAWIISWREHGITESESKFVTPEIKGKLIREMASLVEKNPQLTIFAGTVVTREEVSSLSPEQLEEIEKNFDWLIAEEKSETSNDHTPACNQVKNIDTLKKLGTPSTVETIQNTCVIFTRKENQTIIYEHHKMCPEEGETFDYSDSKDTSNRIFIPGKREDSTSMIELEHPISKQPISIEISICRDFEFDIHSMRNRKRPTLQFLLSNGKYVTLETTQAEYIIQCDCRVKPKLILQKDEQKPHIQLYQTDILNPEFCLRGPLQPLYPFQKRIIDLLDEALEKFPNSKHPKNIALQTIKSRFLENAKSLEIKWGCSTLQHDLEKYKEVLCTKTTLISLFKCEPSLKKIVQDIEKLIVDARVKNKDDLQDIFSITDSPIQEKSSASNDSIFFSKAS